MTLPDADLAAIEERDAKAELIGEPIFPPEGVVWNDSCIMRAYDRRVLLTHVRALTEQRDALAEALAGVIEEADRDTERFRRARTALSEVRP